MKHAVRVVVPFIAPLGLMLFSFIFLNRLDAVSPELKWLIRYAGYFIFAAAALLSWRFNRSRVFYSVLVLAICQFVISVWPCIQNDSGIDISVIISVISIVLPLNILILAFLKERGIFTFWGALKMGCIILQTGYVIYLLNTENSQIVSNINMKLFPWKHALFDFIPQLSILIFLAAIAVLLARYALFKSCLDIEFIGVLAAIFTALCLRKNNMAIPVFFADSGLMLIVSVIRDSYSMAFMDELTGLPSRRALRQELMKLSGRYTIAMLDIDFFKKFNDKYGHDVGDQVLKMVAGCIRNVSGGGKPFRYGGEEFTVLFPGKGVSDSIPHLEELREMISKRAFYQRSKNRPKNKPKSNTKSNPKRGKGKQGEGRKLFVTISIGAAEKNVKFKYADEVIKAADTALYRAKKKGRNCVSR